MPASVYHVLTATTPDDPAYEIRPSHWNSAHSVSLNLSGSDISGAFSNGGNVSFGLETNGYITASANAGGAGDGINRIAAGTQTAGTNATVVFSNSNGISFGMSNSSVVTASYTVPTQSAQSVGVYATSNTTGQSSSSTYDARSLTIRGYGLLSVGNSNGSILLSTPDPVTLSQMSLGISGGNTSGNTGTVAQGRVVFAGTNNITLSGSTNGSSMSISVSGPTLTQYFSGTGTTFNGTNVSGSMTLNTNGLRLDLSAGAGGGGNFSAGVSTGGNTAGATGISGTQMVLVGSGVVSLSQTTGANGNTVSILAPATSSLSATGNASLSVNGSTISVGANAAAVSLSGNSTSAGAGYSHVSTGTLYLAGGNNITLSQNGASVTISGANAGGAQTGISGIEVSNTTYTSGTVTFRNANGISFGSSGANGISASYTVPDVANFISRINVSAGTTSNNLSALTFADGNGISFGLNASTVTASHNGLTSQSNQAVSAANGSYAFQTLSFSNANGVSFGTSAGSAITASYTVPTQTNQAIGLYASSQTTGQSSSSTYDARSITFRGAGIVSVGNSGGEFIISATGGGGGVTPVVSANNGSYSFTTLSFSNANGISFGTSAGSAITASHNALTTARASNDAIGLNTAQSNVTWTVNSSGLSLDARGYAGTGTSVTGGAAVTLNSNGLQFNGASLAGTSTGFAGANISGSITHNTAGINLSLSVAAPGAAAENNNINLLGANTAGNTTASGSTIGWSGINVTLSGTNGSVVNISAPATSSLSATGLLSISTNGSTISLGVPAGTATMWQPFNEALNVAGQQGQGILHLAPLPTPVPAALGELHVDRLCLPLIISNSSNSTGSVTLSYSLGLYTKNGSTLSLAASTSYSAAATFSGTVNNSTFAGLRLHTVPWTTTIVDGRYYVAHWSRTTTGGTNCTVNQWLVSQANSNYSGIFGANSNRSLQYPLGYGVYSVSFSTAMPSSIAFSVIDGTASIAARPPSFFMINGTV